jgi:hypothetical protein
VPVKATGLVNADVVLASSTSAIHNGKPRPRSLA